MEAAWDTNCEGPPSFLLWGESACDDDHHHHLQTSAFPLTWNTSRCWCPRCHPTPSNNRPIGVVFSGREVSKCRGGELGRGDDREGCQLVMVVNRLFGCCSPLARRRRVGGGRSSRPTTAAGGGGRIRFTGWTVGLSCPILVQCYSVLFDRIGSEPWPAYSRTGRSDF